MYTYVIHSYGIVLQTYVHSCCEGCAVICPEDIIRGVCVCTCMYVLRTYMCIVLHS